MDTPAGPWRATASVSHEYADLNEGMSPMLDDLHISVGNCNSDEQSFTLEVLHESIWDC